jgi:hypothetical protein
MLLPGTQVPRKVIRLLGDLKIPDAFSSALQAAQLEGFGNLCQWVSGTPLEGVPGAERGSAQGVTGSWEVVDLSR